MGINADAVQRLYVAYFNRPADAVGLDGWQKLLPTDRLATQAELEQLADQGFSGSQEYANLYAGLTNSQIVDQLYVNLFGRHAETAGLNYWANELTEGRETFASIALQLTYSAQGTDAMAIANKLTAALAFSAAMDTTEEVQGYSGYDSAAVARNWLKDVDHTAASLEAATSSSVLNKVVADATTTNHVANSIFTLQEIVKPGESGVPAQTAVYWGYNPHDHEYDPDGSPAPSDGGIPVADLISFLTTITGLDLVELGLIDANGVDPFQNVTSLSLTNPLSPNTNNSNSGDGTANENSGDGYVAGIDQSTNLQITFADGTFLNAEVALGSEYFNFLNNLLFDADGNSRLYEKVIVDEKYPSPDTLEPIVLTPNRNNGGTIESDYFNETHFTTAGSDLIVAGRLELLHGAYIDGGDGWDILEVDAKGVYAQPTALLNIEEIRVQNLPNVYNTQNVEQDSGSLLPGGDNTGDITDNTDSQADNDGYLDNSTYPYLSGNGNPNSVLDLSRAVDIERLIITEGTDTGSATYPGTPLGSLTIVGVRNGAVARFEGAFTEDVNLHYGQGLTGPLTIELLLGQVTGNLNFVHNTDALNLVSLGGVANTFGSEDIGGRLSKLTISGDAALYIRGDLDDSFQDDSPVTIDASTNEKGVALELSGSQNVTFYGSLGDDTFVVDTSESDLLVNYIDDDSVTIIDGGGNNHFEIESEIVNVTLLDGNNKVAIEDAESITMTAGNGDNHFQIADGAEVSIVVGDGNNRMEIEADGMGDEGTVDLSLDYQSNVSITAGNGQNNIDVEVNEYIGVATIVAGDGGNEINVSAHEVNITTGSSADVIKVLSDIIVINSGGGGDTITIGGWDYDYVGTDELGGNAPSNTTPEWGDDGALVQVNTGSGAATIHLGSGENYPWEEDDEFPGVTSITAMEGSFITGENITLFVDTVADLRAATLTGITRVVLDDDSFDLDDAPTANDAEGGINAAVLTLTTSQFLAIGAENFSVEGAVFNTHGFIKLIVDETTSLTDLGVDQLPRNIDLLLEVQDGVTLTMTAQQMHTRVAQNGVSLANDGNTDYGNGQVVITGGGLNFDPFNTSDTVRTVIGGTQYLGGSLSDDFMSNGSWYNVTVRSVYNGYDRPADAEVVVVLTIDSTVTQEVGAFSTWHDNLEIVGDQDINFTGAINLAQGLDGASNLDDGPFNIDFSSLEGVVNNLTVDGFEHLAQGGSIRGNSNNGYASEVLIQIAKDVADDGVGFDEDDADSLDSKGVSQYTVTVIEGPTANGSAGSTATIKLCDTAQDIEVFALRGNYNDTLVLQDAAWGLVFELQGGGTAKAEGPTGTANVGILDANFEWEGADAVVNMTHSVAGDTRAIYAAGIEIDNAKSITVNAVDGNAIIDHIVGNEAANLIFASEAYSFSIHDTISIVDLSGIDASAVMVDFTATLNGTADGAGFDFVASAGATTLTLVEVTAGHHSSFTAEDAATFTLIIAEESTSDLSAATLVNVDAVQLSDASEVTLTQAQVDAIVPANITLVHPGYDGTLHVTELTDQVFDSTAFGAGVAIDVTMAEGTWTIDPATDFSNVIGFEMNGAEVTMTADQLIQLATALAATGNMDAFSSSLDGAVLNITDVTQANADWTIMFQGEEFNFSDLLGKLSDVNGGLDVAGTMTLAESLNLSAANFGIFDELSFDVVMGDDMTLGLATEEQADGLNVTGGANSIVKLLFGHMDDDSLDVSGYNVAEVQVPNVLVAGSNVDTILSGIAEGIIKVIYNFGIVDGFDQVATIEAGVTVGDFLAFDLTDPNQVIENFTLNLLGGVKLAGDLDLSLGEVQNPDLVASYLQTLTINSIGTDGNLTTGETANIITGDVSVDASNNLLSLTINADQVLMIEGEVEFSSMVNDNQVATLTVEGTAAVSIGSLNTQDNEVDGLNVINNSTGLLTVGIDGGDIDGDDALSFTGTGEIALSITGEVDLSDDDLAAVSQIILEDGAELSLTMEQADTIGAANFGLVEGATTATLNLDGLSDQPFAIANYAEGIMVGLVSVAALPEVTLHPDTDLTGVAGLVVHEGTILNLTAAQFQQLGGPAFGGPEGYGSIIGIDENGDPSTAYSVNITDLTQVDVDNDLNADGDSNDLWEVINLTQVTADNKTITLGESVALQANDDLAGFDVIIPDDMTLTLADVQQADGLSVTGGANSTLEFTDLVSGAGESIDASGFDVDYLRVPNVLVANRNVDLLFLNLNERATKVIYDGEGMVNVVDQIVTVVEGTTVDGFLVFNTPAPDVEIEDFTLNLMGGTMITGNLRLSTTDKESTETGDLIRYHLKTLTINSEGTAGNVYNGETANIIGGDISPLPPVSGGGIGYTSTENNLLNVTINATQDLIVEGNIIFNSVTGDDDFTFNDDEEAVATLTVNGTADVTLGALDTSDVDVDGLNVVNNGTGTLSAVLDAGLINQAVDNNDALSFTGANIELTIADNGAVDLSDDVLTGVSQITIDGDGELTLTQAQLDALGVANLLPDTDTGTTATLNLVEFGSDPFDATTVAAGITVASITMAVGNITLDPLTDLTGVGEIFVPEGGTLNLTAAQFQQLAGIGSISGLDVNGDTVVDAYTVNITDLTQADVTYDANNDGDTTDVTDTLDLSDIVGANVTVSLLNDPVILGTFAADGSLLSAANLNGADVLLADDQMLSLVNLDQADGLNISGGTNTTLEFLIESIGPFETIDASGFDVDTLRLLDIFVANRDVEFLQDLASDVLVRVFRSLEEMGHVSATNRQVFIEESVTVPGFLVFNDWQDDSEVRTLTLTMDGGVEIDGNLRLSTVDKDPALIAHNFDTLTVISQGTAANIDNPTVTANVITGDITGEGTFGPSIENNLLNVNINAIQDFIVEGDIIFTSIDEDKTTATLTMTGTADVTVHGLDVSDDDGLQLVGGDIVTLHIANDGTGTFTATGGTPAIFGEIEELILTGTGDMAFGTAETTPAEGVSSATLSLIDASDLSGDLDLGELDDIDSADFTFIAGTGVTKLLLTDDNLDSTGVDTIAGNTDDTAGWTFDFSSAAAGSEFHWAPDWTPADYIDGSVLNIIMGPNAVLYIDESMDLSGLDLSITGAQAIVLAAGVDLVLTAAQASGLSIIADPAIIVDESDPDFVLADVPTVTITELGGAAYNFANILAGVQDNIDPATLLVANAYLAAGTSNVADVTIDAAANLGDVSISLIDVADGVAANDDLAGQTVRFNTVAQAERIIVLDNAVAGANSTNVVWLFENITAPVNTANYDGDIGRLWVTEELITAEGGDIEQLFTTLPSTILRVDFSDVAALNVLLLSASVHRVVEFVNFTALGNLTFNDVGLVPIEHVEELTLDLGGEVTLGNIDLNDDLLATVDPDSVVFNQLNINSKRALHQDDLLASEHFVNDNDGIDETGEHIQPDAINTIGNISVGANLDLLVVNIDTFLDVDPDVVAGQGLQPNAGAAIDIGTITYGARTPATPTVLTAELNVTGDNDVTISSVIVTDTDITGPVVVDTTGFTATLSAPGTSPGIMLGAHIERLEFTNTSAEDVPAAITIVADDFDNGNESLTVNYTLDGVAGSLVVDLSAVDPADATAVAAAVATALNDIEGISASSALGVVSAFGIGAHELAFEAGTAGGTTTTLAYAVTTASEVPGGTITLGTSTNAGVYGSGLSVINAAQYGGTLNLGILALFDGTNDDSTPLTPANDGLVPAFTLTAGTGVTTATVGKDPDSVAVPTLAAGSEWIFDYTGAAQGSSLIITDEVVFQAPVLPATDLPTLTLMNVDLYIQGDVNLTGVDLGINATSDIFVPAGNSLTLTLDQIAALPGGVVITGEGTVHITGAVDTDAAVALDLSAVQTVGVDLSLLTNEGVVVPQANPVAVTLNVAGAVDDDGEAVGYSFVGSPFNDDVTGSDEDDTLNGAAGDDTLTGGNGNDTFLVTSGTDTITDLTGEADDSDPLTTEENDVLVVSGSATAIAETAGFVATAATSNTSTGTGTIMSDSLAGTLIDMSLATGTKGWTIVGSTNDATDSDELIGSAFADVINGGNLDQSAAAAKDILTGNAGGDTFQFDVDMGNTTILAVTTTQVNVDKEAFQVTVGDAADENDEVIRITYTIDGALFGTDVSLVGIDPNNTIAVAGAIASALQTSGSFISSATNSGTDTITATANTGLDLEITGWSIVGGTVTTLAFDFAPATEDDGDIAQVTELTATGTPTAGDSYVLLADVNNVATYAGTHVAGGVDGPEDVVDGIANTYNVADGADVLASDIDGDAVAIFTDQNADNGGFTLTTDTTAAFGGSGASSGTDYTTADVITDFVSGLDKVEFRTSTGTDMQNGSGGNYMEAATVADAATALTAANTAFTTNAGTLQYYLTSATDFDGVPGVGEIEGAEGGGLLYFDANLDGNADGVIVLLGVSSLNFAAFDIIAS